MPQYDFEKFEALLNDSEKRRILAIFAYQTAPITCDWDKVAAATGSASVNSTRVSHGNMIRKLKAAELNGDGEAGGSAAVAGDAAQNASAKPKTPRKRKAEGGDESAKKKAPRKGKGAAAAAPEEVVTENAVKEENAEQ